MQFLLVEVDADFSCFLVFADVVVDFLDAVVVDLSVVFVVVDQCDEAVFPFEHVDLFLDDLYLFVDELAEVECFFSVVDFFFFISLQAL